MNITVYGDKGRKYCIRYRADSEKVQEGVFTIENEKCEITEVDEDSLFNFVDSFVKNTRGPIHWHSSTILGLYREV